MADAHTHNRRTLLSMAGGLAAGGLATGEADAARGDRGGQGAVAGRLRDGVAATIARAYDLNPNELSVKVDVHPWPTSYSAMAALKQPRQLRGGQLVGFLYFENSVRTAAGKTVLAGVYQLAVSEGRPATLSLLTGDGTLVMAQDPGPPPQAMIDPGTVMVAFAILMVGAALGVGYLALGAAQDAATGAGDANPDERDEGDEEGESPGRAPTLQLIVWPERWLQDV